ncbi:hypothetical protein [Streptomyces sp. NPDC002825]|uniref:hypothetical protein n=1 Tax=Streptomyces sp. NPDC002825 TaxID=3154666 RepID=UPI0033342073
MSKTVSSASIRTVVPSRPRSACAARCAGSAGAVAVRAAVRPLPLPLPVSRWQAGVSPSRRRSMAEEGLVPPDQGEVETVEAEKVIDLHAELRGCSRTGSVLHIHQVNAKWIIVDAM